MISQETISQLLSVAKKYSEKIDTDISVGWFEDSRKEKKHIAKCHDGDYVLTKGLREGNKALMTTYFIPIKIDDKCEIREARFHDNSIIEILSGKLGYAKYKIHSYHGKARYIKLRSSICHSINDCIIKFDNNNEEINMKKTEYTNNIIEKCIRNNIVRKSEGKYLLNNDLYNSVKEWCKLFRHFKNEEQVFFENFCCIDGSFLDSKSVKCHIENERNKINYDIWLKNELKKNKKINAKIYKIKIKNIKL
jgi:hypothetical protein